MVQYKKGEMIAGTYRVERVFGGEGKSGMGVVYLVSSHDSPKPFVLKTIQPKSPVEAGKQRFLKEASIWVAIGWHPHIVKALWIQRIDDALYVAAEYIAPDEFGRNNLTHFLETMYKAPATILRWMAQVCYGLVHAQAKGMRAHRDLKPDNIMIDITGNARVTDFGLASQREELSLSDYAPHSTSVSPQITITGSALGTLPYMAPEQFRDARSVDHRADIYALGIILYQLVSAGQYPYEVPSQVEDVFMAYERIHFTGAYRRISSPFADIIDRCLCKDPAHRYQSYADFLFAIGSAAATQSFSLPPKPHAYDESIEELYMHAQSFSALGQPEKALDAINRYLKYVPEAYWGWTEKGRLLFEAGDAHGAIDSNRESLNLYGGNTHAWNNLGLAYNRLGQNEASIKAFRNALMNDPQNVGAMMNMAAPFISSGRFAEASSILQKAIRLYPKKGVLLFNASNHAALMLKNGKTTEAIPLLELLTQEDPKNSTNWHNLALIHQSQGNRNAAIQCFKAVEQLDPNDSSCVLSLTRLLAETGAYDEAIVYCDKLLQRNAEVLKALSMKAQLLAATGRAKEAIGILSAVLQNHPESDPLWFILAEIQMGIGDRNGAIESLNQCKKALIQNPAGSNSENVRLIEQRLQQLQMR